MAVKKRKSGVASGMSAIKSKTTSKLNPVLTEEERLLPVDVQNEILTSLSETVSQDIQMSVSKFELVDIPLSELGESHLNPRQFYSEKEIKERAVTLAKEGQLSPISVMRKSDGTWLIKDGHYRVKSASLLKWKKIRAEIHPLVSDEELYVSSYAANEQRKQQTVLDNALTWKILSEKGYSIDKIAKMVNRSEGYVSKLIKIGGMEINVLQTLSEKETEIGFTETYQLTLAKDKLSSVSLLELSTAIKDNDLDSKSAVALIKQTIKNNGAAKKKTRKAVAEPIISLDGKKRGDMTLRGTTFKLSFKALSAERAKELAEKIELLIEKELSGEQAK